MLGIIHGVACYFMLFFFLMLIVVHKKFLSQLLLQIERILHGHMEIQNFSSSAEKYFTHLQFFNTRKAQFIM